MDRMPFDPIVAIATPPGRSALAVVRLSGSGAFDVAARVIHPFRREPPRRAWLGEFRDRGGALIDRGVYTVFPEPRSYSGEDLVELSCHGGLHAPARLVAALQAAGARPALPGEFTKRAVLNGKMDLLQAEAVADLIDATAGAQARAALDQLDGALSRRLAALRGDLVGLQAMLSYQVDFPEEDDGPLAADRLLAQLGEVSAQIGRLLATAPAGERLREGAIVVLAGPPNAGKSSLFNALLGTDRALVTDEPGTTRDAIEAGAEFLGWPVRLLDTAGVASGGDRISQMGMTKSRHYIEAADLVLLCVEAARMVSAEDTVLAHGRPTVLLRTKTDLGAPVGPGLGVSVVTGDGLDQVRMLVAERVSGGRVGLATLEPVLTRARHRESLSRAALELGEARPHLESGGDAVLAAHHVRAATLALEELVGTVEVEQVLERVFASFCIGK
jgi:tRNA modification GTPase